MRNKICIFCDSEIIKTYLCCDVIHCSSCRKNEDRYFFLCEEHSKNKLEDVRICSKLEYDLSSLTS